MFQENRKSQFWFRWKWLRKRRPKDPRGIKVISLRFIKDLLSLLNRNLVIQKMIEAPLWHVCFNRLYRPVWYNHCDGRICDFEGVLFRNMDSSKKQSQQATAWVPMFSNLTQKNGTIEQLQSIALWVAVRRMLWSSWTHRQRQHLWVTVVVMWAKKGRGKRIPFIWVIVRRKATQG